MCELSVYVATIMQKQIQERNNVARKLEREKEKAVAEVHDKFDEIIKRHGSERKAVREKAVMEFCHLRMGLMNLMNLIGENDEVREAFK